MKFLLPIVLKFAGEGALAHVAKLCCEKKAFPFVSRAIHDLAVRTE